MLVENWGPGAVDLDEDFHLQNGSPCIDAGNKEELPPDLADLDGDNDTEEDIPYDFEGDDRVIDCYNDGVDEVDMGADEAYYAYPPFLSIEVTKTEQGSQFRLT